MIKIAVTGPRPRRLGGYNAEENFKAIRRHMRDRLERVLKSSENVSIISGGALGIDQFWMEVGIYLGIPVTAALPFEGYNDRWPLSSRVIYDQLLDKCSNVIYICEPGFEARKLQIRNEWMVDHCNVLDAYYIDNTGGTFNCVRYAESVDREINRVNLADIINVLPS
jgi:uncharacterized phage-like protein YoqJ